MNSKVIKFVAGGGKTTYSEKYLEDNKNGLYLAFNNSVVNELRNKGHLCKTIDALFTSFIIPKFTALIPLIATGARVKYQPSESGYKQGINNIGIDDVGNILNKTKKTGKNLNFSNTDLHNTGKFTNSDFIKSLFTKDSLMLTDKLRGDLSNYIIKHYPDELLYFLEKRFSYIIIDEAQDLKDYREKFAKLLFNSKIKMLIMGDDNQNINGGGEWFEQLKPDSVKNKTFRCTDNICKWIRENLNIEIYGVDGKGKYEEIDFSNVLQYDDGNRVLLYSQSSGKNKEIINDWNGEKLTIKKSKGLTIKKDIVIIGESLNVKNLYIAITRTTKNCFSTINKINM